MRLRPFPPEVGDLLSELKPPPRLVAHLALVHDVACQLTTRIKKRWPGLNIDQDVVHLGAAIHDIGKVLHPRELSEAGCEHEAAGQDLLLRYNWPGNLARFAVTHGRNPGPGDSIEDLLVAVADKVWKGKREEGLEQALITHIASGSGDEAWTVWLALDNILTDLTEAAPERLEWQACHPVSFHR